ncbi:MAG: hypothetical protein A2857_01155 [Candidatus Levybacteria bacterium RIFCSPHIGHO2_01_FULL_36_15]|nr:MAG: hypothetical protein A2857_01155 [Candidatus Levybacteria bacterium RIFCSPHIGHO2_01_FULL_36_15]
MKRKILLLGAKGFIGKNILEKLNKKYLIHSPSLLDLDLLSESCVSRYFQKNRYDVVINSAVIGGSRKEEYKKNMLADNLLMFFNIVKNKKHFGKLIHFGSGAEYDKSKPLITVKESEFDRRIPRDEYGFYKYICSKYIEKSNNITNLRIFGLFGKYEDYRYRFISNSILQSINKSSITIQKDVYFDYVYIDDFIKILEYFVEHNCKYKFYNIGTGKKVNLITLAKIISRIAGNETEIIIRNNGLNNEYTCNNKRLLRELKNFTFTDLNDSLLSLYNWYIRQTISFFS